MRHWLYRRRALQSVNALSIRIGGERLLSRTRWARYSSTEAAEPPEPPPRVIFSGIQPTGVPHLGNYLGALRPWVKLQNESKEGDEVNYSIVDLHAITVPQDPEKLKQWRLETYISLLAIGLDPHRCRIIFQSEV
jgi:tryptophanyl-tRNA synthetase